METTIFLLKQVHPLLFATIAYMIAITVCSYSTSFAVFLFLISTPIIISTYKKQKYRNYTFVPFLFFIIGIVRFAYYKNDYDYFYTAIGKTKYNLKGIITEKKEIVHPQLKEVMICKLQSATNTHNAQLLLPSGKKIMICCASKTELLPGDHVRIPNTIIKQPANESLQCFFFKENILGTLTVKTPELWTTERPLLSSARWLYTYRTYLFSRIKNRISPKTLSLFSYLFLGNKTTNPKESSLIKNSFKQWGVSHYLARSGLHLIIFVALWEFLLLLLPLPSVLKGIFIILLTGTYMLLSWISLSFMRSFFAFLLYKTTLLFRRQTHSVHIITIVALAATLTNPSYIFFLDFQLSFGIAFLLAWINQRKAQIGVLKRNC